MLSKTSHTLRNILPQNPTNTEVNLVPDLFSLLSDFFGMRKDFSKDQLLRPNHIDGDLIYEIFQIELNWIIKLRYWDLLQP